MVVRLILCFGVFFSSFLSGGCSAPSDGDNLTSMEIDALSAIHPLKKVDGKIVLDMNGPAPEFFPETRYQRDHFEGRAVGTADGIDFDFSMPEFTGRLFYGFIAYGDSAHPQPVFYKKTSMILNGRAHIPISKALKGNHDMVQWQKKGFATLGFRVVDSKGGIVYDGRVSFEGKGPFRVVPTVVEGPLIHLLKPHEVTISLETDSPVTVTLNVENREPMESKSALKHIFTVSELKADTVYTYSVQVGKHVESYHFRTCPKPAPGARFTFGYASDARGGNGGGERNIYGANGYVLKKILALSTFEHCVFMQFSGDLIDGYLQDGQETRLQYRNFKRVIEPFAHYFPVYCSMGNHELVLKNYHTALGSVALDHFPFATRSGEAIFADEFIHPRNGPDSEDGSAWDPDKDHVNFPPYRENVFYYTYANTAVIVLNTNYWYAPYIAKRPGSGGNLHGYIMDNQLQWLKETLGKLEGQGAIEHVFVTLHTPFFPNGGHLKDDMWYSGRNRPRPTIKGKPVDKGIIERRDELLDVIVNGSTKTRAILTGDEHNYCKTEICEQMNRYPEGYTEKKVVLSRTIYQINNGAAGAPYYAQEKAPWSEFTSGFTTQNALVLFDIDGAEITMRVMNPDTLEDIDHMKLR